jgi:hypothetical protein
MYPDHLEDNRAGWIELQPNISLLTIGLLAQKFGRWLQIDVASRIKRGARFSRSKGNQGPLRQARHEDNSIRLTFG